jgi:Raf kinase inhibitor-like YbhB/YbcL family protein
LLATLASSFVLTTAAFHSGGTIPSVYSCEGKNVSPALRWTAPPRGTRSLAISVIDPDANGFRHWLGWGIRAAARGLTTGQHAPHEALNSAGRRGFTGPCPPAGAVHHYVFRLYALDAPVGPPFTGHVLAVATLTGTFRR